MKSRTSSTLTAILLMSLALASFTIVVFQVLMLPFAGQDFPWIVSQSLSRGVDPYIEYLSKDVPGPLFLAQTPNMWHTTYFLLIGFGILPWEIAKWLYFSVNSVLAVLVSHITAKAFDLRGLQYFALLAVFVASTPMRVTLFNGQYSIIALLFLTLFFYRPSILSGLGAGVSFLKYSFAFPFAFLVFRRGELGKKMWWATVVPITGIVLFLFFITGLTDLREVANTLIRPVSVALIGTASGVSDLASIVKVLNPNLHVLALTVAIVASVLSIVFLPKRASAVFPALSLVALSFFPHLIYDYVFLLPLLGYVIAFPSKRNILLLSPTLIWHWLLFGLIGNIAGGYLYEIPWIMAFGFLLNFIAWQHLVWGSVEQKPDSPKLGLIRP